jgi:Fur family iron response transcriptional regulator
MEDIEAMLRDAGVKLTRQRLEIARVLFSGPGHLSADKILSLVNAGRSTTSKATVYNTLKILLARGLIRAVIADPNKVFYDRNTSVHHHFYDVRTGELTDIDADSVAVIGLPPLPKGAITEGVDIVVRIRPTDSA